MGIEGIMIFVFTVVVSIIGYFLRNLLSDIKDALKQLQAELSKLNVHVNDILIDLKSNYYTKSEIEKEFMKKLEHTAYCNKLDEINNK